ncbi:unnamed protein product [Cylicocyclus nassatus]|uniref:HAT C-terminal dimerisation domain-containing protein n=1 Tax=Cylicocyclus nassatus TaxID=53992 RepID=A0AA36GN21_CYLNA|nr:unnamed protein product [Cylicocyclus nassatus]
MQKEVDAIDDDNRRVFSEDAQIAITVDEWSSKNASCSLLAITGHALGGDFSERINVVLDCAPLEEDSHTSELVESKILESLSRLGIAKERVSFMIADGASVMVKTASDLGIQYIHCCAHVINLSVAAALNLPMCAHVLKKVKHVVSKLNKSGKLKKMFRRFLNEENLPNVVPMNDAPTRWSSTYFMLCDFLAAMPVVERLLSTCDMLPFEDGEIRILKAMRVFLQPFQAMTNQVCYQTSCCSMFIPVGKLLIAKTEENLAAARSEGLQWREIVGDEWRETADHFLACKSNTLDSADSDDESYERSSTSKGSDMWSLITTQSTTSTPSRSSQMQQEDLQMELQQYTIHLNRGDARPSPDADPVQWWRSHKTQFPLLASSAAEYLVAPCTSVDSERLFSTAGIIYGNKRRGRLTAKHARLFLMINANSNKETSRSCKAWTQKEVLRYGCNYESNAAHSTSEESYSDDSEELEEEDPYVFDTQ